MSGTREEIKPRDAADNKGKEEAPAPTSDEGKEETLTPPPAPEQKPVVTPPANDGAVDPSDPADEDLITQIFLMIARRINPKDYPKKPDALLIEWIEYIKLKLAQLKISQEQIVDVVVTLAKNSYWDNQGTTFLSIGGWHKTPDTILAIRELAKPDAAALYALALKKVPDNASPGASKSGMWSAIKGVVNDVAGIATDITRADVTTEFYLLVKKYCNPANKETGYLFLHAVSKLLMRQEVRNKFPTLADLIHQSHACQSPGHILSVVRELKFYHFLYTTCAAKASGTLTNASMIQEAKKFIADHRLPILLKVADETVALAPSPGLK